MWFETRSSVELASLAPKIFAAQLFFVVASRKLSASVFVYKVRGTDGAVGKRGGRRGDNGDIVAKMEGVGGEEQESEAFSMLQLFKRGGQSMPGGG